MNEYTSTTAILNWEIFKIKAIDMLNDGIKIYKSKNGVYLVDFVDTKYIIEESLDNLGGENG